MAKVIQFPIENISDKDKKIARLEAYIHTNLIALADQRRKLHEIVVRLRRSQISLVAHEKTDGK